MSDYTESQYNDGVAAAHFNAIDKEKPVASAALSAGSSVGGKRMQQYKNPAPIETEETRPDGTPMIVERHADGTIQRFYEEEAENGDTFFVKEIDSYK